MLCYNRVSICERVDMPLYEYLCTQCHRRCELIQKVDDPPLRTCKVCGGAVKKVISPPAIQFKGTGWYITDYARKSSPDKAETRKHDKPDRTVDACQNSSSDKKPSPPSDKT
jgi:putative FmdB family regulatory protein